MALQPTNPHYPDPYINDDVTSVHLSPEETDDECLTADNSDSDVDGSDIDDSPETSPEDDASQSLSPEAALSPSPDAKDPRVSKDAAIPEGSKATRRSWTARQKLQVVEQSIKTSQHAAAKRYGVRQGMISRWAADVDELRRIVKRGEGTAKRVRPPGKYKALWELCYSKYKDLDHNSVTVTVNVVRRWMIANSPDDYAKLRTRHQYRMIGRWKKRYGLSQRRGTGMTQLLPEDYEIRIAGYHCVLGNSYSNNRPSVVITLDETQVVHNCPPTSCLAERGSKHVPMHHNGNEKTGSTALLWSSVQIKYGTDGEPELLNPKHEPPVVIFKGTVKDDGKKYGKNTIYQKLKSLPKNKDVKCFISDNGWITAEGMIDFAERILPKVDDNSGWVIMDMYPAHKESEVIQAFRTRGYTVHFVPPGCTSKAQFHDVYVNRTFKKFIEDAWIDHMIKDENWEPDRHYIRDTVADAVRNLPVEWITRGVRNLVIDPARQKAPTEQAMDAPIAATVVESNARKREREEKETAKKETRKQRTLERLKEERYDRIELENARITRELAKLKKTMKEMKK